MSPVAIDAAIRAFAAERHYPAATLGRWLRLREEDRTALLGLAQELRLGEHQLCTLWEWVEEIAQRDQLGMAAVLCLPTVEAARRQPVGRNDRLKLVKGALRRLRYPQLSQAEDRWAALVRSLALPANVRLVAPAYLEGDELRVEITARTATALRAAARQLAEAAATSTCDEIFDVLEGAPRP